AGKSILLDSLGLAIGNRAEARLVRSGKDQGVVTAEFDLAKAPQAKAYLDELGLEIEGDQLFIRRILQTDGKSRCFINDQPTSVTALKTLGDMLVEIHGQHDQRGLLDPSSHRDLLDDYGNLGAARKKVESAFALWREKQAALSKLKAELAKAQAEEEYLRHALAELEDMAPEPDEEDALAEKRQFMMQGEKRVEAIQSAMNELEGATSVSASLNSAVRMLTRSSALDGERCAKTLEILERAAVEVDEAVAELGRIAEESLFDPHELDRIEERLFGLRDLARKHRTDIAGLAPLQIELKAKLDLLENQTTSMGTLEEEVKATREAYVEAAQALSKKRHTTSKALEKAVMDELSGLKMAGTKIVAEVTSLAEDHWQAEGMDKVVFLASTNPGSPPAPLAKIASGGELSRFMLALKVAMRELRSTPTVIFDEIDTGTGGAVADAIGKRLARLGEMAQVLVVTHLPQVAACGSHHLKISKAADKQTTRTQVEELSAAARQEELARMLAGADITDEARAAAGKLIAG
ncbi:MAG: DNA repair protein RecN, partial [Rickettsiales bacterium]